MGEIIRTTTERGRKGIIYDRFSYRLDRARPGNKVIDWRCTYTKSKCKARLRTDDTAYQQFADFCVLYG